jgi:hypothetical protein
MLQVVAIEISTHSSRDSLLPVKHQALFEEIVQVEERGEGGRVAGRQAAAPSSLAVCLSAPWLQMTLCKYGARPHWAFGTNRMFLSQCALLDTWGDDYTAFEAQVVEPLCCL